MTLRWMAASVVGFGVAGLAFHFPGSFPVGSGGTEVQPGAAAIGGVQGLISGAVAGALMWWAVRPRASLLLIPATGLGFAVTHALADGLPANVPYGVIGIAGGMILGLAQERAFAPRPGALTYSIGSALGIAAGIVLGLAAVDALGLATGAWTPATGALQHGIASAVTGALWSWSTGLRLFGSAARRR